MLPGPPYSRKKVRVLLSLDLTKSPDPTTDEKQAWLKEHVKRQDDYTGRGPTGPSVGSGSTAEGGSSTLTRTRLAHDLDPAFLAYLLSGVQFAIGDLPGETSPSTR